MQYRFYLASLIVVLLTWLIFGCSPSSQSDRYNRPKEVEEKQPSSVRFTSTENTDTSTVYNIPDELEEFDDIPVEDVPVDTREFIGKYERMQSLSSAFTTREKILFEIISYLETPYKYGGVDRNGIDCSAFTQHVFDTAIGLQLPRTSSEQFSIGELISSKSELTFGDLIFFNTTRRSYPGHVGIYIGENLFAHASRSLGVTVSSLESSYYKKRYVGARRIK
ncbi:MAG: C40 family peptidase [Melioribacteraceae bacterium]|nr:MAG: C40 family peptidase [Melioribacteraceae bacterium]